MYPKLLMRGCKPERTSGGQVFLVQTGPDLPGSSTPHVGSGETEEVRMRSVGEESHLDATPDLDWVLAHPALALAES